MRPLGTDRVGWKAVGGAERALGWRSRRQRREGGLPEGVESCEMRSRGRGRWWHFPGVGKMLNMSGIHEGRVMGMTVGVLHGAGRGWVARSGGC